MGILPWLQEISLKSMSLLTRIESFWTRCSLYNWDGKKKQAMRENEKRGTHEHSRAPGFESWVSARSPVQGGGERRYERTLEEIDEEEESAAASARGHENNNKVAADRVKNYVAYTIKLPSDQLSALQSIWLELKKLYGTHSPDKSGMIQSAIDAWLKRWDGPDRDKLLEELLDIRQSTRRRQYRKGKN